MFVMDGKIKPNELPTEIAGDIMKKIIKEYIAAIFKEDA